MGSDSLRSYEYFGNVKMETEWADGRMVGLVHWHMDVVLFSRVRTCWFA